MYEYRATVIRVVDGDTIDFRIDLGFRLTTVQRVRLLFCNCPELHNNRTHEAGVRATDATKSWLSNDPELRIRTHKSDSFGRWLADVYREEDPVSLSQFLVENGFAVMFPQDALLMEG